MSVLICGSIAYDTIMVFPDRFKQHILPDQIHILNVSFLVPDMRREFGGCAGNIAYNLKLLGGAPLIMATVGQDAGPYMARLASFDIPATHVRHIEDAFTAQCFITTDLDDNQITAFHPGAMNVSHENRVSDASGVKLGIVAPDGRDGMVSHAQQFADAGIPFVFDPGQGMPMFDGKDLLNFLDLARWCTVNDYEARLLCERTGLSEAQVAERVDGFIVTRGAEGSRVYAGGTVTEVACVKADALADPTGCGDAYRGGLLYGLSQGADLVTSARLASVMGSIKIASRGGQNHAPSRADIAGRYRAAFGTELDF
ncbi:MAG: carbohydrate kinase family protein [Gammaproteobacteria bacterium]|jgi:adenosine kinase|nr:carbohydrate kinase family protein [Gammaproteobacteria bacterium]MBU0771396.1 carbohydrate kinase family protein [Gammaproteobacteria bacterium]MBU0857088.1 carbohydrate kinase family protein [Gammaproteobacteria bacterium]MBU1847966.1 carbohydrate kinase family protein [Gammaproteobacteria bacterium]